MATLLKQKTRPEPAESGGLPVARPSPQRTDLITLARRRFQRGEPTDVESLASELGISRATAYRWAGNGEQLMGEVVASLTEATFRRNLQEARGKGAARVLDVMERGMHAILGAKAYREFLKRDPQKTLRIVASKDGPSQRRVIELYQQLLEEETAKGHLKPAVDAHTMAYALVRTAESFLYADLIAGEEPDVDKAIKIMRLMLR
jgi:AcrR family transcriptional regulator